MLGVVFCGGSDICGLLSARLPCNPRCLVGIGSQAMQYLRTQFRLHHHRRGLCGKLRQVRISEHRHHGRICFGVGVQAFLEFRLCRILRGLLRASALGRFDALVRPVLHGLFVLRYIVAKALERWHRIGRGGRCRCSRRGRHLRCLLFRQQIFVESSERIALVNHLIKAALGDEFLQGCFRRIGVRRGIGLLDRECGCRLRRSLDCFITRCSRRGG
jgi:hypothetical protein